MSDVTFFGLHFWYNFSIFENYKVRKVDKKKQLQIILEFNQMTDDVNVGIKCLDDIKTFAEALEMDDGFCHGDYYRDEAREDLKL